MFREGFLSWFALFLYFQNMSCLVCNRTLVGARFKSLKEAQYGKEETLFDLLCSLVAVSGKCKSSKLVGEHACLSCFRELSHIYEMQNTLEKRQR